MDYLYEVTEELFFVSCRLDTALKKQMKNSGSYYRILQLSSYKNTVDFYLNRRRKKTDEWNLNFYLKNELQKKLNMRYTKIPVNERDQEYVVIVSTQILGDSHSPSLLTLHFSYLIEKYLKKKVLLLCTTESSDLDALNRIGVRKKGLIQKRYLDQNGKFNISYRERKIECYQICLDDQTWEEQCRLIEQIYERKPLCVWQFGGIPAFAAAMQQFTSFYYMQMNAGYPAVSADLVINYFQNSGKCYPDEWDMLRSNGVPVTNMFFTLPRPHAKGIMKRGQFGIPEDAFCLGIAGNRLKEECTDNFINMLKEVMDKEKDIQIVFIGYADKEFQVKIKNDMGAEERCFFLGAQKELEEALALIDLYVDLPHQGGGYIGVTALSGGKPVLCLNGGDVSAKAGEEFCFETLEEYTEEIIKYKNDKDYYRRKSARAKDRAESITLTDSKLAALAWKTITSGLEEDTGKENMLKKS